MNTLNNQTDNNKWFDVSYVNGNGEKDTIWATKEELRLDFSESFYQRTKNYHTPITPQSVISIDSVIQVKPGNENLVCGSMMSIRNMVDTLLEECNLGKIKWLHEAGGEIELYKVDSLFDILIGLCKSCKDEIKKQLDYLEVSERDKL